MQATDLAILKAIKAHLGLSESDYGMLVFDVYLHQADRYDKCLPQYLRGKNGLVSSVAFRNWFNTAKVTIDGHIHHVIKGSRGRALITAAVYQGMLNIYFSEGDFYPDKSVIEVAVGEYKARVLAASN